MAVRLYTGLMEVSQGKSMPVLHVLKKLCAVLVGSWSKPPGTSFEEVQNIRVQFEEIVTEVWVLFKQGRTTHCFDRRADYSMLCEIVEVIIFDPGVADLLLADLSR